MCLRVFVILPDFHRLFSSQSWSSVRLWYPWRDSCRSWLLKSLESTNNNMASPHSHWHSTFPVKHSALLKTELPRQCTVSLAVVMSGLTWPWMLYCKCFWWTRGVVRAIDDDDDVYIYAVYKLWQLVLFVCLCHAVGEIVGNRWVPAQNRAMCRKVILVNRPLHTS